MRLLTLERRSVPSASMRSSRAPRRPRDQRAPGRRAGRPSGDRVGPVEEQRAAHERRVVARASCPPGAPAPAVGHSVEHQRASSSPRGSGAGRGRSARCARGRRRPARARWPAPGCRSEALTFLASVSARSAEVVEVAVARVRVEGRASAPGSSTRSSGHASRSRIARCSSSSSGAASVVERTSTVSPRLDLQAVAAQQLGEAAGSRRSRRLQVGEVLGEVLAQDVADPAPLVRGGDAEARAAPAGPRSARRRSSSARPGARTAARPRAARRPPGAAAAVQRRRAYWRAGRASASRAATSTLPSASAYRSRGRSSFSTCRARGRACPCPRWSRPRARAAPRTSPVSGSAWPAHAAAGSSAASLRIDARACSVSWLNAVGHARVAVAAGLRIERVEAVADQREAVGLAPQPDQAGRVAGQVDDLEAGDLVALGDGAGDLHGPPSHMLSR